MDYALKQLDDLMIEEDDTLRLQPCFSPVWDTALTLDRAWPTPACPATHPAVPQAARLAARQARCAGRATGA